MMLTPDSMLKVLILERCFLEFVTVHVPVILEIIFNTFDEM